MIKKLLLSVLAIFGFAFFFNDSVFADSPTVTIDGSNYTSGPFVICDSNNPCDSYDFIHMSSTLTNLSSSAYLRLTVNGKNISYILYVLTDVYFPTDNITSFTYQLVDNYYDWGDNSLVFTLEDRQSPTGTLNITSNGTFDVTNYSSAVVNVPQTTSDLPPYSELVVDSFWQYHVAIAGGLASIFAIFVVYRIIKSRLR